MKLALDCFGRFYKKLDCHKCAIKSICGKVYNSDPSMEEKAKNAASKILIETKKALCAKDGILLLRGRKVISNMFPSWQIDNEAGKIGEGDSNELEKEKRTKHTKERKMFQVEDGSLFYLASIPSIPRIFLYKLGVDERGFSACEGLHRSANQLAYWYHPMHQAGKILVGKVVLDKLPVFDRVSKKLLKGEDIMAKTKSKTKEEENGSLESLEELEEIEVGEEEELESLEEIEEEKPARKKVGKGKTAEKPDPKQETKAEKKTPAGKGVGAGGDKKGASPSLKKSPLFVAAKAIANKVDEKAIYTNFLNGDGKKFARILSPERIHLFGNLDYIKDRFKDFEVLSEWKGSAIFLVPEAKAAKFIKLLEKAKLGD